MSLFCILWLAEKGCEFRRRQRILVKHVLWPFVVVLFVRSLLLSYDAIHTENYLYYFFQLLLPILYSIKSVGFLICLTDAMYIYQTVLGPYQGLVEFPYLV